MARYYRSWGKHGYTFLGRYNILDRATHRRGWDWLIKDVFTHFGSDISDVVSLGCSVGVNEVILAINHPHINVTGIDVDEGAIKKAKAGVWPLDDIRPSGLCIGIGFDDETIRRLYELHCPKEYFEIDFRRKELRLREPVKNVSFEVRDGTKTNYANGAFDLVVMYMLHGRECQPYRPVYVQLGQEVERIVKPDGLFWTHSGLYRVSPQADDSSPFKRILLSSEKLLIGLKANQQKENTYFHHHQHH